MISYPAAEAYLRTLRPTMVVCSATLELYGHHVAVPDLVAVRCAAQHAGHGGDALEHIVATVAEGGAR